MQLFSRTTEGMVQKQFVNYSEIFDTWGLWKLLTLPQKDYLEKNCELEHYKRGQMIYTEGELPSNLMCLARGKVKIIKKGVVGRQQIVRMIKPVEMFGYRAFFAEERYVTSASACEMTSVYLVPREVIQVLIRENNDLACYFIKLLSVDLGESDVRTVSLTQKHIRGRLADALIFLKEKYGYDADGVTLSICLSRDDLASLSNMTTSNAIRTLSQFSCEKIIATDGRKIKIIDEHLLRKVTQIG